MPRHHLGPRLRSAASLEEKSLWLNMLGKVESPPSMEGYLISLCCIQSLKIEFVLHFQTEVGFFVLLCQLFKRRPRLRGVYHGSHKLILTESVWTRGSFGDKKYQNANDRAWLYWNLLNSTSKTDHYHQSLSADGAVLWRPPRLRGQLWRGLVWPRARPQRRPTLRLQVRPSPCWAVVNDVHCTILYCAEQ